MASNINGWNYTINEEMDSCQIGDNTIELTGAVIMKVENRRRQNGGQTSQASNQPARYILTNFTGRKVRLLIWPPRDREFEGQLLNQAVKITRARVAESNAAYRRAGDGLMDYDISIQKNSTIEVLGPIPSELPQVEYRPIELRNAALWVGQNVSIAAYIKMRIESVDFNNSSYGSGSVTDFTYKLIINVTRFDSGRNYEEGAHVLLKGLLRKNDHNTIILQVASMEDISLLDNSVATNDQLKRGFSALRMSRSPSDPALNDQAGGSNRPLNDSTFHSSNGNSTNGGSNVNRSSANACLNASNEDFIDFDVTDSNSENKSPNVSKSLLGKRKGVDGSKLKEKTKKVSEMDLNWPPLPEIRSSPANCEKQPRLAADQDPPSPSPNPGTTQLQIPGSPLQNPQSPSQNSESSWQNPGSPQQNAENPWENLEHPSQNPGSPPESP